MDQLLACGWKKCSRIVWASVLEQLIVVAPDNSQIGVRTHIFVRIRQVA